MNIGHPLRELLVEPVENPVPGADPAGPSAPPPHEPARRRAVPRERVARRPEDPGAASPARV